MTNPSLHIRHGRAWVALALALALHVADEASHDFLSVYNPTVRAIREATGIPLPVFDFGPWLVGLIAGILLLLAVSPAVFRGWHWTIPLSYVLGVIMTGNALGHLSVTVATRRPMPGVYSSPLLLAASLYLIVSARRVAKNGGWAGTARMKASP